MQYGFRDAIAKVGLFKFLSDLFWIGMFYHLYNQVKKKKNEKLTNLTDQMLFSFPGFLLSSGA